MVPKQIKKIDDYTWELPKDYKKGMVVPARIIATEKILNAMDDGVFEQVSNVASMPGVQKYALCMPDGHWGYGFPIGGVAAFDAEEGIISPGSIGFDINCGMRLITTNLSYDEVKPKIKLLIDSLFKEVPSGVGSSGALKLSKKNFIEIAENGVEWCVENGYAWKKDLEHIEDYGKISNADMSNVSERAIKRGFNQVGTLGSGNHYLEIQVVPPENIFDKNLAQKFGIEQNKVCIMVHTGSRGFGHQIATDYLKLFGKAMNKYNLKVNDKELACAPFQSEEGQKYFSAMACGANMAFVNRQIITNTLRNVFSKIFNREAEDMEMNLVYDVAHNIAKVEKYKINGEIKPLIVHRKGATRSFGPGRKELPEKYQETGQPVIIGGSMETGSYLLVGTKKAEETTFGSTAHGSGRVMSRHKAKENVRGEDVQKRMHEKGIYVRSSSMSGLAEESGSAYKNINDVVETVHDAKISLKVAAMKPIGNIKG